MTAAWRFWIAGVVSVTLPSILAIYQIAGTTTGEKPKTSSSETKPIQDAVNDADSSRTDLSLKSNVALGALGIATADLALPDGMAGTTRCASCHPSHYQSYLLTHHSRSLQKSPTIGVDPTGTLVHAASRRSYDVLEKDSQLRHREWRHFIKPATASSDQVKLSATDPRMPIAEFPVSYVMGSGSFAKGYLLSDSPYLIQSPVTWYTKPEAFGMAPGYDRQTHAGMTRVVSDQCLFCHAGMVSRRNENEEQLEIVEAAIGCERCHGAGKNHSDKFRELVGNSAMKPATINDSLIVHPGKLERDLAEAICAQCHLQGDVVVDSPGKSVWDFKPGERFDKTRVIFKIESSNEQEHTFVDHFDQLWQSKCYQESDSLTCITCHDPHHRNDEVRAREYQQTNCLKCHDDESCGIALPDRHLQNENQCVLCHMPKSASEVPHSATTNHQIRVHHQKPSAANKLTDTRLRRLGSPLNKPLVFSNDRTELLATAFWALDTIKLAELPSSAAEKTLADLLELNGQRNDDAMILSTIAQLARKKAESSLNEAQNRQVIQNHWQIAGQYASQVLSSESSATGNRKAALEVIAAKQFSEGDFQNAASSYRELVRIRRSAIDWYNLGLCYGRLKQFAEAEQSFIQAIRIDGTYTPPYRSLSILYSSIKSPLAEQMRQTFEILQSQ